MFKILKKEILNESISKMTILAPNVARNIQEGQFIILRVDEFGERIPLTVFDYDRANGTIDIIYQKVGTTTYKLDQKQENDYILDVVGPLGKETELLGYKKTIVVSGGVGIAIAYPVAKKLKKLSASVDFIAGFRNKDLIILENDIKAVSDNFDVTTDDGSNGKKGFVTNVLEEKLSENSDFDVVIAIGPLPMMKAVCNVTKKFNIKTIVSMTAIMIDGTGMCGGCRLNVGGKIKFACVDGPDFDGHEVNFDETMSRLQAFKNEEDKSLKNYCNLLKGV